MYRELIYETNQYFSTRLLPLFLSTEATKIPDRSNGLVILVGFSGLYL